MLMYAQITDRCNMRCRHCMFNCTHIGRDMDWETFQACIDRPETTSVNLGGGEPTLHPLLFDMIKYCADKGKRVWLATNGKNTDVLWELIRWAKLGVVSVRLSLDKYHSRIDPAIKKEFEYLVLNVLWTPWPMGNIGISYGRSGVSDMGRAKIKGIGTKPGCSVDTNAIFVKPDGSIMECFCESSEVLGNIKTYARSLSEFDFGHGAQQKLRTYGLQGVIVQRAVTIMLE